MRAACSPQPHKGDHARHPRPRPRHHQFPRHRLRPRRQHRQRRAAGVPADLSPVRMGGARRRGDLGDPARRGAPGARTRRREGGRRRRHRHHQPARDDRGVGPRHRRAHPQRHRLAGPPDRGFLRCPEGQGARPGHPAEDRPGDRRLLLRQQAALDPGQRARRPGPRREGRTGLRHDRHLAGVEADRRRAARDRRQQRLADDALQHRDGRLGRRSCSSGWASRGRSSRRSGPRPRSSATPRRTCSTRRSPSPGSRATSRPRSSASSASNAGSPRTPTAPAASC